MRYKEEYAPWHICEDCSGSLVNGIPELWWWRWWCEGTQKGGNNYFIAEFKFQSLVSTPFGTDLQVTTCNVSLLHHLTLYHLSLGFII